MAKTSYFATPVKIKVIGLGGGGCNAVTRMAKKGIAGVELVAMDTDAQVLAITDVPNRILLGEQLFKGLGVGDDHLLGQRAAEASRDEIIDIVSGADLVFVTCGLGGGTGTGAAPIVAEISKQSGALTIAIVTKPFTFEGTTRARVAEEGSLALARVADALIIISNDRFLDLFDPKTSVDTAFKLINHTLCCAVKTIAETVTVPGLINLDLADIMAIMKDAGLGWVGFGRGYGQNRAIKAAKQAVSSPLMNTSIDTATRILFRIIGGSNLTLHEVNDAASVIWQAAHPDANIIFGVSIEPDKGDEVELTLIATGYVTKKAIPGITLKEQVRRLLQDSETEELEIPSFLRRPYPRVIKPLPKHEATVLQEIMEKGYLIFNSNLDAERSSKLKQLRDEIMQTNPPDICVDLLNSLWRLSQDTSSISDYSSVIIRYLRMQSPDYEVHPLYHYYSFISSACRINSAQDISKMPSKNLKAISRKPKVGGGFTEIPTQTTRLLGMLRFFQRKSVSVSYIDKLRKSKNILSELSDSLKSELQTPETIALACVVNRWLKLVAEAIKISLGNLRCTLATNKPLYLDIVNEVHIQLSGAQPGQSFQVHAPLTPNYDVRLNDTCVVFQETGALISLQVTPHVLGKLNLLIEIEGVTFEVEALVVLQNPFVVGIPVQTDDMFVGRQDIIDRVIRGMVASQPTNFLITGRRRIGKTSLLYAIKRQMPKGILPVVMSTETCGKTPDEVCQALANAISGAIRENQLTLKSEYRVLETLHHDPVGSFISWLQSVHEQLTTSSLYGIALLIDEAFDLTGWDNRVQKLLRYLFSSMTWIRGVLAGPPDIIERMTEDISSPLYNIFTTIRLGPIDIDDTRRLIVVPLQRCGVAVTENMLTRIYEYSGGIPFYIQAIGHELIETYFSNKLIGEELLSKSLTQVRERLKTSYPVTLRKLPAQQKISIVSVASGLSPPEILAKRLERADLIEMADGKWRIRAAIEREWIREYRDELLDSAGEELWVDHKKEIDFRRLVEDLRRLKQEFTTSGDISQSLTSAISAAERGNGAKTLKYLAKVGQQVLDTAINIGADVAAAVIKQTYGLS